MVKFDIKPDHKKILMYLERARNVTQISKKIDRTWLHTNKCLKVLREAKLIESTKNGKTRTVKLTRKGEILKKLFEKEDEVMEL